MSGYIDLAARLLAYERRRAVPIRQTSALTADPVPAFGIAPIRVVSEELIQAVAFGPLNGPPAIATTWNPLDREPAFLEPLADQLHTYLTTCFQANVLPRVWLPHGAALDVLDILGHRYRTNRRATDTLRRLGWQCRALVDEASYPGQQVVAVASALLTAHVVTGQSPSEDRHLRALLAWVNPPPGSDPLVLAEQQSLVPAAAMLPRDEDDAVEALRQQAFTNASRIPVVQPQIEGILRTAARREWDMLLSARQAFWQLGLPPAADLDTLVDESRARIGWRITRNLGRPSRPHSLSNLLDAYEHAQSLTVYLDTRSDAAVQEREVRAGRLIRAELVAIDQPQRNRHPCTLTLQSRQDVLRVRRGTVLALFGSALSGRVVAVREQDADRSTLIDVRLDRGVMASHLPRVGSLGAWGEPRPFDGRSLKRDIYGAMQDAADPRVYGEALPDPEARPHLGQDLASVAERLRKR